jgi:hypothetical protein
VTGKHGIRVRRQVTRREFGPAPNEAALLREVADAIENGVIDVQSLVVDWRDDGCYVEVFAENYSIVRAVVRLAQ